VFRARITRNRITPVENRALRCIPAAYIISTAMLPVRVRAGLKSEVGIITALPMTIIIAIVSPMARPMPSTIPATIPERAAGSWTCHIICHWVAPIASAASLYPLGTARRLSSLMLMMVGSTIAMSTREAARILKPVPPI
jgi:hypothetical protein